MMIPGHICAAYGDESLVRSGCCFVFKEEVFINQSMQCLCSVLQSLGGGSTSIQMVTCTLPFSGWRTRQESC
jgi:hypothetical protein